MAMNVPVDQAAMGAFIASKPTLVTLKAFAGQYLTAHGKSAEEVQKFLENVESLVQVPIAEGATLVTDKNAFRKAAVPAPYAVPVAEYSDLFPAKM
jgi:insulysin